jgi:hypothetical protein
MQKCQTYFIDLFCTTLWVSVRRRIIEEIRGYERKYEKTLGRKREQSDTERRR